jgi:ATP-dependent helicase/nuclease subunit B
MLRVVTGRFHPTLESAFVEQIQRLKADDAWAGIAVVVPSKALLDRVRRLLAVDHQLSLLNVHLLTFHQFALRLAAERRRRDGEEPFRIVDDLFFEYLVRQLVQQQVRDSPPLRQLGRSSGTWAALWSTIRDLKDAAVDPRTAQQALDEGCFGHEDQEWLRALFALQAALREMTDGLHIGTPDDLAQGLVSSVSTSPFLASLRGICYYGFYDLTQVQLSLFQEVTASIGTTLFFPLGTEASYAFARRFFDRHIQPLLGADAVSDLTRSREVPVPEVSIQSVIGPEEELATTCRTILDLVETHDYRFDEIGVIARTLEPYGALMPQIFDQHRIPFLTTAGRPLIQHPLGKTLLLLATLPVNDFYHSAVLHLVTSPFFRPPDGECPQAYRPEQWRAVVEALNITHGLDAWRRLEQSCGSTVELDGGGDEPGAMGGFAIAADVLTSFSNRVSALLASYADLPERGSFRRLFDIFRRLAETHMCRPADPIQNSADGTTQTLWETIDATFMSLDALALVGDDLTWAGFAELLTSAFERASVPLASGSSQGVLVLDAMAARGLPFKALFLLGLNERVFPRHIREDPFLRDRHRLVLETTLGYKVDAKLPAYDEEALLYTLLSQAASRRLCLSFQRADASGRILGPSPYLTDMPHRSGMPAPPVDPLPRRITERLEQRPTMNRFLSPTDLAQWMTLVGNDPTKFLQAMGGEPGIFHNGVEALARTEGEQLALTAFDGMTGPLEGHWTRVTRQGMAPTPLERYAQCPFRYFAADVLALVPARVPVSDQPDARVLGTFCHGALRRCYELLLRSGWPEQPVTAETLLLYIEMAVHETSIAVEQRYRTGHYLLWELEKTRIVEVIRAAVEDDSRAYVSDPFTPVGFEVAAEGAMTDVSGQEMTPLKIKGRIDRFDRHRESGALRVIDYKLKLGPSMTLDDRHLAQSAVRGYRLQPALYTLLRLSEYGTPREIQLFFLAPRWSTPVARSTFEAAVWRADAGTMLRQTLSRLISGIRNGRFFIVPDAYCETCEFRIACRREHQGTWWRASQAAESRELTALRTIRIAP